MMTTTPAGARGEGWDLAEQVPHAYERYLVPITLAFALETYLVLARTEAATEGRRP